MHLFIEKDYSKPKHPLGAMEEKGLAMLVQLFRLPFECQSKPKNRYSFFFSSNVLDTSTSSINLLDMTESLPSNIALLFVRIHCM